MLIDQGLFALLVNLVFAFLKTESAIIVSTVIARICSSLFNYTMNKKVVFKSGNGMKSFVRYYILCAAQMIASAAGVTLAYILTRGNSSVLKLIIDLLLFFVSYQIQRRWVFVKGE